MRTANSDWSTRRLLLRERAYGGTYFQYYWRGTAVSGPTTLPPATLPAPRSTAFLRALAGIPPISFCAQSSGGSRRYKMVPGLGHDGPHKPHSTPPPACKGQDSGAPPSYCSKHCLQVGGAPTSYLLHTVAAVGCNSRRLVMSVSLLSMFFRTTANLERDQPEHTNCCTSLERRGCTSGQSGWLWTVLCRAVETDHSCLARGIWTTLVIVTYRPKLKNTCHTVIHDPWQVTKATNKTKQTRKHTTKKPSAPAWLRIRGAHPRTMDTASISQSPGGGGGGGAGGEGGQCGPTNLVLGFLCLRFNLARVGLDPLGHIFFAIL